jgi:hypothetical protein
VEGGAGVAPCGTPRAVVAVDIPLAPGAVRARRPPRTLADPCLVLLVAEDPARSSASLLRVGSTGCTRTSGPDPTSRVLPGLRYAFKQRRPCTQTPRKPKPAKANWGRPARLPDQLVPASPGEASHQRPAVARRKPGEAPPAWLAWRARPGASPVLRRPYLLPVAGAAALVAAWEPRQSAGLRGAVLAALALGGAR